MLIVLPQVLNTEQLKVVSRRLTEGDFVDGKNSAGDQARRIKFNQELTDSAERLGSLNNLVMGCLVNHPVYLNAGLPRNVSTPYYCRYRTGMRYGSHIDDPVMGQGDRYRADIAITLFLNGHEEYDGGELRISTSFGSREVKLPAGDAVMYPASSRHEVREVTSGERLVAVTWMQSLVLEAERRELLYQLYLAREKLLETSPEAESTHQVNQSYVNLVRMWSRL